MTEPVDSRPSVWNFEPAAKISGTNRVLPVDATEARALAVMALVPITRVSDVTPLDPLGLPAFAAVTPLAADLTSHMGKGRDAASAKVSAIMEAVERVSAEAPVPGATRRSSFAQLTREHPGVIDPVSLSLPSDSAYRPDAPFTWVESHDLMAGGPVWMASDLVTNPPTEGILREVDTNGLAAGNTLLEATVHGLCEVIERDAWSQEEFVTLFGDENDPTPGRHRIDLGTLPGDAGAWAERVRRAGLELVVHDITSDVGVATFQVFLTDPRHLTAFGPRPMHFLGLGTHPWAATAVFRAISEAVQGRLSYIQGARDSYNTTPASSRSSTAARRAAGVTPGTGVAFSDVASVWHDDVRDDLRFLVDRLVGTGLEHAVVTDLTRAELGIPVVRVRVPGLSGFVVNRRRVDWRCLRHLL